jgi:hypothetical protein
MATKRKSTRPAKKSQPTASAKNSAGFAAAFSALQKMLEPYEKSFQRIPGRSDRYWLATKCAAYRGQPFYFAGVAMNKSYVSFHLMPIYLQPKIAKNISPALSKRRQGKCCFNFTAPDAPLFEELASMTRAGFALYEEPQFMQNLASAVGAARK